MSETWLAENVYCPYCGNSHLSKFANNKPVADFIVTLVEKYLN